MLQQFQHRKPEPSNIALGLFDSGVGGLSVVRELYNRGVEVPMLYVADQIHAPYGCQTIGEVKGFSEGITNFLTERGVNCIVLACNTASAAALYHLREKYPHIPFVGMEPAVKPASENSRNGRIAVLATRITFQGELYNRVIKRYAEHTDVETVICSELVELVEQGDFQSQETEKCIRKLVEPLLAKNIDQLVLGCTHFSFLKPVIREIAGEKADIVDPANAVATQTLRILNQMTTSSMMDKTKEQTPGLSNQFFTTGRTSTMRNMVSHILQKDFNVCQASWQNRKLEIVSDTQHDSTIYQNA